MNVKTMEVNHYSPALCDLTNGNVTDLYDR